MLRLSGIRAGYGQVEVLHGVDLVVPPGEVVGLLGANGAGKSTLLKVAAGLVPADAGTVTLDGSDITTAAAVGRAREGLCLVPEGRAIFRQLSVRENLAMAGGGVRPDVAVDRATDLFPRLGERLAQTAGSLSGGEQQMLALVRAFVAGPKVVLVDELSLGLAPVVVDEIFDALARLRGEVSLLVVEQYASRLLEMADYVSILQKGSVAFVGEPAQCRDGDVMAHYVGSAAAGGESRSVPADPVRAPAAGTQEPSAAETPGLVARDIAVRFGGVVALDGFSLAAPAGRITGLIGPNGAGKTTMFNVCCGFQRPDEGRVTLDGVDITADPPPARAQRGLARTFQQLSLFRSMTVRQNVALAVESRQVTANPLTQLGFRPRRHGNGVDAATDELLSLVGVAELADRPAHALSTGQARLVELARALARRPRILLLDEPASGLGPSESEAFGELLRRLVDGWGLGILLVEHDMSLALSVCDWIHVLDFGRPLVEGPPADLATSAEVRSAYLGTLEVEPV